MTDQYDFMFNQVKEITEVLKKERQIWEQERAVFEQKIRWLEDREKIRELLVKKLEEEKCILEQEIKKCAECQLGVHSLEEEKRALELKLDALIIVNSQQIEDRVKAKMREQVEALDDVSDDCEQDYEHCACGRLMKEKVLGVLDGV